MDNTDDRWLSRRELADRYGLPVKTLAQWASKGTGPRYARLGRHARYRLSDVIAWEAERLNDHTDDRAQLTASANPADRSDGHAATQGAHLGGTRRPQ